MTTRSSLRTICLLRATRCTVAIFRCGTRSSEPGALFGAAQGAPFFLTSWLAYLLPVLACAGMDRPGQAPDRRAGHGTVSTVTRWWSWRLSGSGRRIRVLQPVRPHLLGHGQTSAFALVPWSLLAIEKLVSTGTAASALGLALSLGLTAYNGHPESFLTAVGVSLAYLIFRLVIARRDADGRETAGVAWSSPQVRCCSRRGSDCLTSHRSSASWRTGRA